MITLMNLMTTYICRTTLTLKVTVLGGIKLVLKNSGGMGTHREI